MGYYVKPTGEYYEGDQAHPLDQAVPQRPSALYLAQMNAGLFVQWVVNQAASDAAAARQSITDDAQRIALVNALKGATNAQIDTYINANVTDLPSARLMLSRMAKVLALIVS